MKNLIAFARRNPATVTMAFLTILAVPLRNDRVAGVLLLAATACTLPAYVDECAEWVPPIMRKLGIFDAITTDSDTSAPKAAEEFIN